MNCCTVDLFFSYSSSGPVAGRIGDRCANETRNNGAPTLCEFFRTYCPFCVSGTLRLFCCTTMGFEQIESYLLFAEERHKRQNRQNRQNRRNCRASTRAGMCERMRRRAAGVCRCFMVRLNQLNPMNHINWVVRFCAHSTVSPLPEENQREFLFCIRSHRLLASAGVCVGDPVDAEKFAY